MRTFHLTILALISHLCPVQSHKQVSQYLSVPLPIMVKTIPMTMAHNTVIVCRAQPNPTLNRTSQYILFPRGHSHPITSNHKACIV